MAQPIQRDSVTRFFASGFFLEPVSPKPLIIPLGPFGIFPKIRGDIRSSRFATGVNDTGFFVYFFKSCECRSLFRKKPWDGHENGWVSCSIEIYDSFPRFFFSPIPVIHVIFFRDNAGWLLPSRQRADQYGIGSANS